MKKIYKSGVEKMKNAHKSGVKKMKNILTNYIDNNKINVGDINEKKIL